MVIFREKVLQNNASQLSSEISSENKKKGSEKSVQMGRWKVAWVLRQMFHQNRLSSVSVLKNLYIVTHGPGEFKVINCAILPKYIKLIYDIIFIPFKSTFSSFFISNIVFILQLDWLKALFILNFPPKCASKVRCSWIRIISVLYEQLNSQSFVIGQKYDSIRALINLIKKPPRTGWPDSANYFHLLGDCLLWAVTVKVS
jgi:hypothetical protein